MRRALRKIFGAAMVFFGVLAYAPATRADGENTATPAPTQPVPPLPAATPPQPPPIKVIEESGDGPYYYRDVRPTFGGGVRLGSGFDARLGVNGEDGKAVFGFDVLGVGRLGFGRGPRVFALWPEAGYSYVGSDWHFIGAGVGPALQAIEGFSFGIVPRALYGIAGGKEAKGLRTSMLFDLSLGQSAIGFEVAHQYVEWGDHHVHELRFAIESSVVWGRGDSR